MRSNPPKNADETENMAQKENLDFGHNDTVQSFNYLLPNSENTDESEKPLSPPKSEKIQSQNLNDDESIFSDDLLKRFYDLRNPSYVPSNGTSSDGEPKLSDDEPKISEKISSKNDEMTSGSNAKSANKKSSSPNTRESSEHNTGDSLPSIRILTRGEPLPNSLRTSPSHSTQKSTLTGPDVPQMGPPSTSKSPPSVSQNAQNTPKSGPSLIGSMRNALGKTFSKFQKKKSESLPKISGPSKNEQETERKSLIDTVRNLRPKKKLNYKKFHERGEKN